MTARHRFALTDWLACAAGGAREPAAVAARAAGDGLLERVAAAGAAGHVLDFADTYAPGLAHLSAATAPAALVLGAELGATVGAALAAYAAGFEAMGALARTCHPALYDGGWHPTAVCGSAGAAVVAARLQDLDTGRERRAIALALLRAGGLRAAFGSDGKALQVGMASAAGVHAARLAAAGAAVDAGAIMGARAGFAEAFSVATSAATLDAMIEAADSAATAGQAVAENWIKAYPCCLQTHAAIDAALALGGQPPPASEITVTVHPVSRRAAALDEVGDGLQAKFSIPYLTAYALLRGAPDLRAFAHLDVDVAALARRVRVRTDPALGAAEAILELDGRAAARVTAPRGSPANPLDAAALASKVRSLAGEALAGALEDASRPAAALTGAAGL
ncbi:MAG: MmgE/PrpD family protein [Solirubrobacteraceae bacterium]